ncbi:amidohydrolase [Aurantibacter crassamenti]|uniref:amidohydrolase n=1 Tax=Aurantibacter crassamenti TaxID=1837375 RepID=UPI001939A6C1|nr:amidohydrolase [Aurantibacter crassamenti]MBM1107675.1 amidohydrolase [Aurantibacter crassamenti]
MYIPKSLHSYLVLLIVILTSCSNPAQETGTLLIHGGPIYTVDSTQTKVEAVVTKDSIILFAGSLEEAEKYKNEQTQILDLEGNTMTPGLIEGHGHFMGLGISALELDLTNTNSYEEIVAAVAEKVKTVKPGEWIIGTGWHQSKWNVKPEIMVKGFQTHDLLSAVSPNNPVVLGHVSGHAVFANAAAMDIAGIHALTKEGIDKSSVEGGEIIRDALGRPTGIFNETATDIIWKHVPTDMYTPEKYIEAFDLAIAACHENGIVGFHDAGIGRENIEFYEAMKSAGKMTVRMYAMLTGGDMDLVDEWGDKGPLIDPDNRLTIRSIKLNCDGALGSRGAWLLEEYTDQPGHFGHETLPMEVVKETAIKGLKNGFQVCSHAIGDRANREILDRYESAFKDLPEATKDHRFRIEHAQHLHPDDIPRFAELGVIPAMQAIHMSSDRPWAIDRLGQKRIEEGAYMWQDLLKSGIPIINGTDVPVEPLNPIASLYASISRKTLKGTPEGGYEPAQKMTRTQALRSYTLDAAYGAFEENIKGSITAGKLADFTIYNQDIMTVPEDEFLKTEIAMTIFNGEVVYSKSE